jgi:hypothetical protein
VRVPCQVDEGPDKVQMKGARSGVRDEPRGRWPHISNSDQCKSWISVGKVTYFIAPVAICTSGYMRGCMLPFLTSLDDPGVSQARARTSDQKSIA